MSAAATSTPVSCAAPRRHRPGRGWLIVVGMALLIVLVVSALLTAPPEEPLSPTSTASDGSRALARVLTSHDGVEIVAVGSAADLRSVRPDQATTVIVPSAAELTAGYADAVEEAAARAGRLVLVRPSQAVLDRLEIPLTTGGALPFTTPADCETADVAREDEVARGASTYRVEWTALGDAPGVTTCFGAPSDLVEQEDEPIEPTEYAYVRVPARQARPETVVFGSSRALTNTDIETHSHAAVALRMLGHGDRVVWVMPDPDDEAAPLQAESPVPSWFAPSVALLAVAGLVLCLWRGRRLGRLVVEPLPVVVHAIETTQTRGRLYRASRDAAAALALLQRDTTDHLRRELRLHHGTGSDEVADAVARRLDRDRDEVHALLTPSTTLDEADLVEAARRLRRLRHEVHDS